MKLSSIIYTTAAIAGLAFIPLNSSAQEFRFSTGGPGGMSMGSSKIFTVQRSAVQKELELTDEQKKKIKDILGDMFQVKESSGERDDKPKFAISLAVTRPSSADGEEPVIAGPDFTGMEKAIDKVLNDKQKARLRQIILQQTGMIAVAQDDVAKELELTADQKTLVKEAVAHQQKEMQKIMEEMFKDGAIKLGGDGGGSINIRSGDSKTIKNIVTPESGKNMADKMRSIRSKTEEELGIILTADQKIKWEEMLGPKFSSGIKQN